MSDGWFERWGRAVARARWLVLLSAIAGVLAAGWWGGGVFGALDNGGFEDPGSESARAEARIAEAVGRQATDVVVLYRVQDPNLTVDSPQVRQAVEASLADLPDTAVTGAHTTWTTGSAAFVSGDRRATYAAIQLAGEDLVERLDVFEEIEHHLTDVPAPLTVQLGGPVPVNAQISEQISEDLERAEVFSMPVLLALLVLVFGSAVAASLPLGIGIVTSLGAFAVLRLLTTVTDVSVFSINIVTLLGLGLAIDYSLFVVSRFREELTPGRRVADALAATMATAGRTVAFSGITVAVCLSSLALFPLGFLRSMAYGGVAAVLVAMLSALTLLPAVLALLGRRVDAWRVRLPGAARRRRAAEQAARAVAGNGHLAVGTSPAEGRWARLARSVMRRPVAYTAVAGLALLVLAVPFLHVQFGGVDARTMPADAQARQVSEALAAEFAGPPTDPIVVLLDGADAAATQELAGQIDELPGITGVSVAAQRESVALLHAGFAGSPMGDAPLAAVSAIRALPVPDGAEVMVTGTSAVQVDLRDAIAERLPWMAGFVALATIVLMFLAFGSLVLPLQAIGANLLSLAASFGVVVWIFQDGNLAGLLDFTSTGTIELTQPILMLAILFGLSMDYEVFLVSRIREEWDRTGDAQQAVAIGLQRTGRIITSAALLLVVVIGAFSTSGISFIKMIGVGMAVAIVLDATVVRALLVPATLRLLGRYAWWAPAPLARWWSRYGWRETEPTAPVAVAPAGPAVPPQLSDQRMPDDRPKVTSPAAG